MGLLERSVRISLDGALPALIVLVALAAGLVALLLTPREEEPQIVVPMADVRIEAPTLSARQVERLVTTPLEKVLTQIDGVEHVYSVSEDGRALVTVRFFVGEDREDSLLKLYNKVFSNQDLVPVAVTSWVVKPVEIDDVPVVIATLWTDDPSLDDFHLRRIAEEVAVDLQRVPDTNRIEVIGGRPRELRIDLDPTALAARNTAIDDILFALRASNVRSASGHIQRNDVDIPVETNALIGSADELRRLTINVVDGIPVRLDDVATVRDGPAEPVSHHWITLPGADGTTTHRARPAVDVAIAKKKGANAVAVTADIRERLEALRATILPAGVHYEITRDYGETAQQKITDLIWSLGIAVLTVVGLIGMFLGWRAALVVALAVPVCYGITLALGYAAGYTINRVTLFALILALGLLVDDPITGVDNIERHLGRTNRDEAITGAIMEIRWPLIMSTIAIVIVFAPMQFITGMMGPYMSPMAFNVPVAVVVSTFVAFMVTPWLGKRLLVPRSGEAPEPDHRSGPYSRLLQPLLASRRKSYAFIASAAVLFVVALVLPLLRAVPLKLLPYDNKNEFQVVIDAPEGTTLERADAVARRIADYLATQPEVRAIAGYAGTHSPMDFNGMVRHYFLRGAPHDAELRVMLVDKLERRDQSHALVLRIRADVERIAHASGVAAKLVEVPPGPPVLSTLVAEHYGGATTPYDTLIEASRVTAGRLATEPGVVDIDVSAAAPARRLVFAPDQEKAALSAVSAAAIAQTLSIVVDGAPVAWADVPDEANPLPITVGVPFALREDIGNLRIKGLPGIVKVKERGGVRDAPTPLVSLAELGTFRETVRDQPIYHKDLAPVAYTFAEVAGRAPAEVIYDVDADRGTGPLAELDARQADRADRGTGPLAEADRRSDPLAERGARHGVEPGRPVESRTFFNSGGGIPWALPAGVRLDWAGEGEWFITLRVFRDLGIAFAVALVGLFVVIRIQTGMASLTGIIMLAIPLTAIGIMPGFWLLNVVATDPVGGFDDPVLFTATAMIGMIALAGIVVRNSLILIDFIGQDRARGAPLDDALLRAGSLRARPVLLTAGTTLLGNLVITLDPIFSGLAWAIIFGILASTVFTLFMVPVVYRLVYGEAAHGN